MYNPVYSRSIGYIRTPRTRTNQACIIQKVIQDTFSLKEVPKEALALGMAGVIPYLATSLQTVYLSYEINRAAALGDGLIFNGQSAELMLHMLEPIQVGYGAVVSNLLPNNLKLSLAVILVISTR